jgi:hypothetical protein
MLQVKEIVYKEVEGCGPPPYLSSLKRNLLQSSKCDLSQENFLNDHQTDEQGKKENGAHHSHL